MYLVKYNNMWFIKATYYDYYELTYLSFGLYLYMSVINDFSIQYLIKKLTITSNT